MISSKIVFSFMLLVSSFASATAEEYIVSPKMIPFAFGKKEFSVKKLTEAEAKDLGGQGFNIEKNSTVNIPGFESKETHILGEVVWPIGVIKADQAHKLENGRGKNVKICLIDTGINKKHPLVGSAILEGKSFVEGTEPSDISDSFLDHGTLVASLIVGRAHESFIGVAPEAQLIVAKAFAENGSSSMLQILNAFQYCMEKSNIINMSFGGGGSSPALSELMTQAHAKGITLVAASGNSPGLLSYPANDPAVIAVSFVNENGQTSPYSPTDSRISFVAPGIDIPVLNAALETKMLSGSSFSAAIVSGVEAIRRSRGAKSLVATPLPLPEDQQGHGLIDALATALNLNHLASSN
ncbi:MAG: S8 family serine peptidase [Pseudobdellovibrionaceae bacterium]